MTDLRAGDEVRVTVKDLASDIGILVCVRYPWATRVVRACWVLLGVGCYREVALRRLPARYRLMVSSPEGDTIEWSRCINGHKIPILTRHAGAQREADFLRAHPDCTARLERVARSFTPGTEEG